MTNPYKKKKNHDITPFQYYQIKYIRDDRAVSPLRSSTNQWQGVFMKQAVIVGTNFIAYQKKSQSRRSNGDDVTRREERVARTIIKHFA